MSTIIALFGALNLQHRATMKERDARVAALEVQNATLLDSIKDGMEDMTTTLATVAQLQHKIVEYQTEKTMYEKARNDLLRDEQQRGRLTP